MNDKKKVLYFITKANWGGAQSYVYDLATSLPKESFDVAVVFGQGELLSRKLQEAHVRTIPIRSLERDVNPLLDMQSFIAVLSILRTEQPHCIHLNSSKIGGLGGLAGRTHNVVGAIQNTVRRNLAKLPFTAFKNPAYIPHTLIIFTGHGWAFNEKRSIFSKLVIVFLHWLTVLFSHITVAVSLKTKNDISRLPFVGNKIKVVYNGVKKTPLYSHMGARVELASRYQVIKTIPPDAFWFGTISELHTNKGLDLALEAFCTVVKRHPSTVFIIIGEGEERTALESLITKWNLNNNVFLLGKVESARTLLPAFDTFTLTSRTEALPYTVIEAGYAGVPVIATAVGGIPEIIEDMRSGILIKPHNAREIERAMLYVIEHADKRRSLGEHLKKSVTNTFSFDHMIKATIALYR